MRLQKLTTLNQKKPTVVMDERSEMQEDKAKAIVAIVHEIRNPLTAIKLTSQLMQEAVDRDDRGKLLTQPYLTIIANNITRIEKHLNEVLSFQRKDEVLMPVNVGDCLDKALCEAQDRLYLAGITVNKHYKGSHWVYGNEERLVTAFLNIIVNAIEAIKTDNGKIWVSVYEANKSIRITIKDNGAGMSAATAEKIFDPLFSTKDGIGIGLANVKEIMDLHKANIVADSLENVGTSISILFDSIPKGESPARSKRASGPVAGDH
jgi:signal transduction histidine kinase